MEALISDWPQICMSNSALAQIKSVIHKNYMIDTASHRPLAVTSYCTQTNQG